MYLLSNAFEGETASFTGESRALTSDVFTFSPQTLSPMLSSPNLKRCGARSLQNTIDNPLAILNKISIRNTNFLVKNCNHTYTLFRSSSLLYIK